MFRHVTELERIGGGRNSQVYRVTCDNGDEYAAKLYFRHSLDRRDRLGVEFSSLQFLWQNGVRAIPQPIVADREHECAVYEYIDGEKILSSDVSDSDIEQAVEFLAKLKTLKSKEGSRDLPPASEACFSVQAIVSNIELRLNRLSTLENSGAQYEALREFLSHELIPSLELITSWCQSSLKQLGIRFDSEWPDEAKTLSPSDFGFHNALRPDEGQIVFLDFEYFGWDDSAKMVADFLLHPAMELHDSLKQRFVRGILSRFEDDKQLAKRIEIVYPLFGLKWCMILLNEFVPKDLLRRGFASGKSLDRGHLQAKQLAKAKRMLDRIMRDYENNHYYQS